MTQKIQKIGALLLALIVLGSTMSFTVIQHYCGDFLMSQTVFEAPMSCCSAMHDKQDSQKENKCCSTQQIVLQADNHIETTSPKLEFSQQVFIASFFYTYGNLFEGLPQQVVPFRNYVPPLLVQDVQVLNEAYLI